MAKKTKTAKPVKKSPTKQTVDRPVKKSPTKQTVEETIKKITGNQYKIECVVDPKLVLNPPVDNEDELLNGAKEVFEE